MCTLNTKGIEVRQVSAVTMLSQVQDEGSIDFNFGETVYVAINRTMLPKCVVLLVKSFTHNTFHEP